MAYQYLVYINGVAIKQPSQYNATISDVVNGQRNAQAVFVGQIVRHNMAKVELGYNYLTASEWATILQMFDSDYGGAFAQPVTFFDPVSNTWVTRNMYVSDRKSGVYMLDSTGNVIGWTNPHLSLIEV